MVVEVEGANLFSPASSRFGKIMLHEELSANLHFSVQVIKNYWYFQLVNIVTQIKKFF